MNKLELAKKVGNSSLLFYGELDYLLDSYMKKFFSVEIKEVGFDDNHEMNTLEFWFTVSWLNEMDFVEYGTSPRGAWLTESGKSFKKYVLENVSPITSLVEFNRQNLY